MKTKLPRSFDLKDKKRDIRNSEKTSYVKPYLVYSTVGQTKNETPLFISIQIIDEK